ncbi:mechanosensitive ion channel [Sulfurospirillum sp. T05]|uniref:Mechanosensitive ion channel n=1 Tax=Sulfurospirillum tamanense TaxID=2813362 RepID=A0ABS2WR70_9BACT|nr:mechanosensitive ion channel domain-containing protein [Sulfurospirillum tamanensis]MBN2963714.1 mechanosensitive ion channel [Sulfurospirillum tamanensis]
MRRLFGAWCLGFVLLFAETNTTVVPEPVNEEQIALIASLNSQVEAIEKELQNNIWLTRYSNFVAHQSLSDALAKVEKELAVLKTKRDRASIERVEILSKRQETLEKQVELLLEFRRSPFAEMIRPPEMAEVPKVGNPIAIISGFSFIKQLRSQKDEFAQRLAGLEALIVRLEEQASMLEELLVLDPQKEYEEKLKIVQQEITEFKAAKDISSTTFTVYEKRVEESLTRVSAEIKQQMKRAMNIGIFILVVIALSFFLKLVAKRYIKDNERYYTANKAINFINFTLIVLILLFAYIENVTYLVTVVGFASAGLAIAMKDMFMSLLGWIVITFGGSFHVGDRIKVQKDGLPYVGDIIDISLLRITILEDITLTTYLENRRSGRVVFIPNNYIFTTLISNYTHMTIKTVWDGIDVTITFTSNHKKAMYLIKNIVKKYSKGYTDIARKQLNMLRDQYSLKNTNVEPRIYSFLEPHGLTISVWYMTNSYAALALRSTLSADIVDAINQEDDITIAFPTQTINLNDTRKPMPLDINKDVLF